MKKIESMAQQQTQKDTAYTKNWQVRREEHFFREAEKGLVETPAEPQRSTIYEEESANGATVEIWHL